MANVSDFTTEAEVNIQGNDFLLGAKNGLTTGDERKIPIDALKGHLDGLEKSQNLSDVADLATTQDNLGVIDLGARNVANANRLAAMPEGTVRMMDGLLYESIGAAIGVRSATNDIGVDGIAPDDSHISVRHFGPLKGSTTDTSDAQPQIERASDYIASWGLPRQLDFGNFAIWHVYSPVKLSYLVIPVGSTRIKALAPFTDVTIPLEAGGDLTFSAVMYIAEGATLGNISGSRRDNVYLPHNMTLDGNDLTDYGLFIDNIQNSLFDLEVKNINDTGIVSYVNGWGNVFNARLLDCELGGFLLKGAVNGVDLRGASIFGNTKTTDVGITIDGEAYGLNIGGMYVEKVKTHMKFVGTGAAVIAGVDFEKADEKAIIVDGSGLVGKRAGPITFISSFIETLSKTEVAIDVNNGVVILDGCYVRNRAGQLWLLNNADPDGQDPATITAFNVTGSGTGSRVICRNTEITDSIGIINTDGVIIDDHINGNDRKVSTLSSSTAVAIVKQDDLHSDLYDPALATTRDYTESVLISHGTRTTATRRFMTARIVADNAGTQEVTGESGVLISAFAGATNLQFAPITDNDHNLGFSSLRWEQVWAVNATIQTSDELDKTQIQAIPDAWLNAWGRVEWQTFKWQTSYDKKGDSARFHCGVIAQRVKEAFDAEGVDPFLTGILCFDLFDGFSYSESGQVLDEEGNVVTDERTGRFGIRMEEALALEAAWQRREIQNIKDQITG